MADGYSVTRYRPTNDRAVYASIMNSAAVQKILLAKADAIGRRVTMDADYITTEDVRPGKTRAHARCTVKKYKNVRSFRELGHNRRVDRILQAAIDAARG